MSTESKRSNDVPPPPARLPLNPAIESAGLSAPPAPPAPVRASQAPPRMPRMPPPPPPRRTIPPPPALPSLSDFAAPWLATGQFDTMADDAIQALDDNQIDIIDDDPNPTEITRVPVLATASLVGAITEPVLPGRMLAPSIDIEIDAIEEPVFEPLLTSELEAIDADDDALADSTAERPAPYASGIPHTLPSEHAGSERLAEVARAEVARAEVETPPSLAPNDGKDLTHGAAPRKTKLRKISRAHDPALPLDAAMMLAATAFESRPASGGTPLRTESGRPGSGAPISVAPVAEVDAAGAMLRARLWEQRDLEGLRAFCQAALAHVQEPHEFAALYTDMGRIKDEEGAPERAMLEYGKALEYAPEHLPAQLGIEAAAKKAQATALAKWNEVLGQLRKAHDQKPDDPRATGWLALLFRYYTTELKRRDIATEFQTKLVRRDPEHPVVLERLANEARAQGDARKQVDFLARALPRLLRRDDRTRILLALGEAYEGPLAQPHDALIYFEDARNYADAASVAHKEALRAVERLARSAGDFERVVAVQREALSFDLAPKETIDALIRLAEVLEKDLADARAAVIELNAALKLEPTNRKALLALERCQLALGAWPEVADATRVKAERAAGPRQKIELLFSAAEIYETKASDVESAFDTLREILAIDERNKKALTELARIGEQLERWDETTAYVARIAQLTPDKREASRMVADLGSVLLRRAHDDSAARLQYEKAAELDKRNMAALIGLENIATRAGDIAAQTYIERLAALTEDAHARGILLAKLARGWVAVGDGARALHAYEQAYTADPSILEAVAALLEQHLASGRFAEAEPLCERLIAESARDEAPEYRIRRLRLATRIRASLGAEELALAAALRAFNHAPKDDGTRDDLLEVATRIQPDKLKAARTELGVVAERALLLEPATQLKLAKALAAAGDPTRALTLLEAVQKRDPQSTEPLTAMEAIYTSTSNWQRAAECKVLLGQALPTDDARFTKLCEAGDLWARELSDIRAAARAFEKARALRPKDTWILDTLCWAYEQAHDFRRLAEILRVQSDLEDDPKRRAARVMDLAKLEWEKLKNPRGAASLYEEVLDTDRSRLDAFELLVRASNEADDVAFLERAYRKMIARVKEDAPKALMVSLWQGLGSIYEERVGDRKSALDAFKMSAQLEPENDAVLERAMSLAIELRRFKDAIAMCRLRIAKTPFDARMYNTLFDLFYRLELYDLAWCAVDVMRQLTPLSPEQEEFYSNYPPYEPHEIQGALTNEAWLGYILHPDLDPNLTSLLAWAAPVAARAHVGSPALAPLTPNDSQFADVLYECLTQLGAVLGLTPPPLYVVAGTEPLAVLPVPYGAVGVAVRELPRTEATLPFHVATSLAQQRPELIASGFFPTPKHVNDIIARIANPDPAFRSLMTHAEAETMRSLLTAGTEGGTTFDVKRWCILAHASTARAAVLTRGTVHEAAAHYGSESTDPLAPEKLGLTYAFAVSDEHAALRKAIGNAVGS